MLSSKKGGAGPIIVSAIMLIAVIAVVLYSQSKPYETAIKTGQLQRAMLDSYAFGAEVRSYVDLSAEYAMDQALFRIGAYGGYDFAELDGEKFMLTLDGDESSCGFTEEQPAYAYWVNVDKVCIPSAGQLASEFRSSFEGVFMSFLQRHPADPWVNIEDVVDASGVLGEESLDEGLDMDVRIDLDSDKIIGEPRLSTSVYQGADEEGNPTVNYCEEWEQFVITPKLTDEYGAEDIVFKYAVTPHFVYDIGLDLLEEYYGVVKEVKGVLECVSKASDKSAVEACIPEDTAGNFAGRKNIKVELDQNSWSVRFDLKHTSKKIFAQESDSGARMQEFPIRFAALVKKGGPVPDLLPDVDVAPTNLKFSTAYPKVDDSVILTATIWNWGTKDASNTEVKFYANACTSGTSCGEILLESKTISSIPAGGHAQAEITWTASQAEFIWVEVSNAAEGTTPIDYTSDNELIETITVRMPSTEECPED